MKKLFILILISLLAKSNLQAQEFNRVAVDSQSQKEILVGNCNIKGLNSGEFGRIFWNEYINYKPDSAVMASLANKLNDIHIKIVMGTWCGDSKEQVPRFFRVLDLLYYNPSDVEILCFVRKYKDKEADAKQYNIQKIPTFIIYRNNEEIGRIIETPSYSMEKDLLSILKNHGAKN